VNVVQVRCDRRTFLSAAAVVPAAWLVGCSGDDRAARPTSIGGASNAAGSWTRADQTDVPGSNIGAQQLPLGASIVGRFAPNSLVPGRVRLPISLEVDGGLLTNGPTTLEAEMLDAGGSALVAGLRGELVQHDPDQPQFWIVRAELAAPGIYSLRVRGVGEPAPFQVLDRGLVEQPKPGDPLPPFDTPTVDDPRGVNPVCTRHHGVCPFHTVTLTEALQLGKPIAYLIGTPGFCQFGVCGPMLEVLIDLHHELGDRVTMVHADVYTDDTATVAAPAVDAYRLTWEPALFVADASGMIVERLDITFAAAEVRAVLSRAGVAV
jgi:hypothetical protein